jgi:hypothetical protein
MKIALGLVATGFLIAPGLQAQTADDCIAEFENLKSQFLATAPDTAISCLKSGKKINLDVEGPLPAFCEGRWDHWHLEAKNGGKKAGSCSMSLRGLDDQEGCGTERFELELKGSDVAKWQNYLRKECES